MTLSAFFSVGIVVALVIGAITMLLKYGISWQHIDGPSAFMLAGMMLICALAWPVFLLGLCMAAGLLCLCGLFVVLMRRGC